MGLLFIALHDRPRRLRVNGTATVNRSDPLLPLTVGAQLIVRVTARAIFPNCPRYVPSMQLVEPSIYAPRPGHEPPEPAWKGFADFKDHVHPRQPTAKGDFDLKIVSQSRRGRTEPSMRDPNRSTNCPSIRPHGDRHGRKKD